MSNFEPPLSAKHFSDATYLDPDQRQLVTVEEELLKMASIQRVIDGPDIGWIASRFAIATVGISNWRSYTRQAKAFLNPQDVTPEQLMSQLTFIEDFRRLLVGRIGAIRAIELCAFEDEYPDEARIGDFMYDQRVDNSNFDSKKLFSRGLPGIGVLLRHMEHSENANWNLGDVLTLQQVQVEHNMGVALTRIASHFPKDTLTWNQHVHSLQRYFMRHGENELAQVDAGVVLSINQFQDQESSQPKVWGEHLRELRSKPSKYHLPVDLVNGLQGTYVKVPSNTAMYELIGPSKRQTASERRAAAREERARSRSGNPAVRSGSDTTSEPTVPLISPRQSIFISDTSRLEAAMDRPIIAHLDAIRSQYNSHLDRFTNQTADYMRSLGIAGPNSLYYELIQSSSSCPYPEDVSKIYAGLWTVAGDDMPDNETPRTYLTSIQQVMSELSHDYAGYLSENPLRNRSAATDSLPTIDHLFNWLQVNWTGFEAAVQRSAHARIADERIDTIAAMLGIEDYNRYDSSMDVVAELQTTFSASPTIPQTLRPVTQVDTLEDAPKNERHVNEYRFAISRDRPSGETIEAYIERNYGRSPIAQSLPEMIKILARRYGDRTEGSGIKQLEALRIGGKPLYSFKPAFATGLGSEINKSAVLDLRILFVLQKTPDNSLSEINIVSIITRAQQDAEITRIKRAMRQAR